MNIINAFCHNKSLANFELYPKSVYGSLFFLLVASCSLDDRNHSYSRLKEATGVLICSSKDGLQLKLHGKSYAIGEAIDSFDDGLRYRIKSLPDGDADWANSHFLLAEAGNNEQPKLVTQVIDGIETVQALAVKQPTAEELERVRDAAIEQAGYRALFADFLDEKIYLDSYIKPDSSFGIFNVYIKSYPKGISFAQVEDTIGLVGIVSYLGFRDNLFRKMKQVAIDHDIYLVGIRNRDYYWDGSKRIWFIANNGLIIKGRENLAMYIRNNKPLFKDSEYQPLLNSVLKRNFFGKDFQILQEDFFKAFSNSYK